MLINRRGVVLILGFLAAATFMATPADAQEYPPGAGDSQSAQAKEDQEWLTAYMMAHQGYRLDHMDALEDKFSRMSPTQLHTMVLMYKQKHEADMHEGELARRSREQAIAHYQHQVAQREARYGADLDKAADLEQRRLDTMHQEAYQNYANQQAIKGRQSYGAGGYGYGYGGYGMYR